jgi:ABC-2 type transport system ATP-binding protein
MAIQPASRTAGGSNAVAARGLTPALSPAALEIRGLVKRYGDVEALRGVDLDVRSGEVVAILGPNGAGKTTLISCLLGLRRPSAGSVRVLGGRPEDASVRARVGAMLQESGIPPTLTIAEVIDLFRGYYPAPRSRADVLAATGLVELADRRVGRLSGGQRQRLYFALALVGDPELIFLDEPTTGLDVESRRRFWDVVRDLALAGTTVIFATHLLEEADALATRIVVVDHGRIVREGTPAEVKASAAGATIRIRADLDPTDVACWPGVARVSRAGARLEIVAARPEEILRRIFTSDITVDELTVEERALETAFLDLTTEAGAAVPTASACSSREA